MEDIAIFTGATLISEEKGTGLTADLFDPKCLGEAASIIVTDKKCTIISGQGDADAIEERKNSLKALIKDTHEDLAKEKLRSRIASIGRGVAIVYVGAPTAIEQGDKKDLAEDAILATRSAIEEGYLIGGGTSYMRIAEVLKRMPEAKLPGYQLMIEALSEPLRQILKNNGIPDPEGLFYKFKYRNTATVEKVIKKVIEFVVNNGNKMGYNAKLDKFGDLEAQGVIDPAKVVRSAIENAGSVGISYMITYCLITERPD